MTALLFGFIALLPYVGQWSEVGSTDSYTIRFWTTQDGLPSNIIFSAEQTDEGFLLLATAGGVIRFDGVSFEAVGSIHGTSVANKPVAARTIGNHMWVGTDEGRITLFGDRIREYRTPSGDSVREIILDETGAWIRAGPGFVYRIQDDADPVEMGNGVIFMVSDGAGGLWEAMTSVVRHRAANGEVDQEFRMGSVVRLDWNPDTKTLAYVRPGYFGLLTLDGNRREFVNRGESDSDILRTRDGQYAFLVTDGPSTFLAHVDPTRPNPSVNRLVKLADSRLRATDLFEDTDGNIWGSTGEGGLFRVTPQPILVIGPRSVLRVAAVGPGRVAASRACERIDIYEGGELAETWEQLPDGPPVGCVQAMLMDRTGRFWVGNDRSLSRVRGDETTALTPHSDWGPRTLERIEITALHEDADGTIWVGTRLGLGQVVGDSLMPVREAASINDETVIALASGADGGLWIGSDSGLRHLGTDGLRFFGDEEGVPIGTARAVAVHESGVAFVGWYGAGLTVRVDGKTKTITTPEGLIDNYVSGILLVGDEAWIHTNAGVQRVSVRQLTEMVGGKGHVVVGRSAELEDGFPEANGGGTASMVQAEDGYIWFSSVEGLVRLNPDGLAAPLRNPRTRIRRVLVDGERRRTDVPIQLEADQSDLHVYVSGIFLSNPERVRFSYQLVGFEDRIHLSRGDLIEYNSFPPGSYVLNVRSYVEGMTIPANEVLLEVVKAAFYYQTWWFKILSWALLLGGLSFATGVIVKRERNRSRQLQRLNRALRNEVGEHRIARSALRNMTRRVLDAQEEERRKLARELHDEFGGKLTFLQALLKTDRERSEAMGLVQDIFDGIRHLVRTLRPQGLDLFGLSSAVRETIEAFETATGIKVDVALDIDEDQRFESVVENAAYRFVQEALTNAARHSEARHVRVSIGSVDGHLKLSVTDDGRGFDVTNSTPGVGLLAMRERAELIGGTIDVQSDAEKGATKISMSVPVNGKRVVEVDLADGMV